MKRKYFKKFIAIVLLLFIFTIVTSCTKIIHKRVFPILDDGRYDSEFPYNNASEQLADISNSVKMLNYIAYYKAYLFTEEQNLSFSDINRNNIKNISTDEVYFNESVSGTATIIYYDSILVGLLTCAHIGNFPDTSVIYFNSESESKIVKQIAIKVRDHYFINEIPGEGDFEVIVSDNKRDLAILTKKSINDPFKRIKPFRYPFGESGKLELGNFVYIIGYPMGHKMITRGIISNTRDDKSDSFLIDALFNRGFSGGIILAIRDGVPNFELVGLAKSVSAKNEYLLTPYLSNGENDFNSNLPYEGDLYVKRYEGINYGITYTISTNEILDFLQENEAKLSQNGINIKNLIQR